MRKFLLLLLIVLLLAPSVSAADTVRQQAELSGANRLPDALNAEQRSLLSGAEPTAASDFGGQLMRLISGVLGSFGQNLRATAKTLALLAAVLILCSLTENLQTDLSRHAVSLAGALAITVICTQDVHSMAGLAGQTLDEISSFTALLLPVMSSVLTASGAAGSASALYVGSALFMDVLLRVIRQLVIPLVYAYIVLAAVECAVSQDRLEKMRELIGWVIKVALRGVMYLFTAYLAVTGIISGTADAAAIKAAKAAISTALPVVGSIVSDASESILAGAAFLKSTAGVFGLLSLLAIGLRPFLQIGVGYLALKLASAVGGTIGSKAQSRLLGSMATAMGFMLAAVGCAVLMALIGCCCFMKVTGG